MKTVITLFISVCVFIAITLIGFNLWCWAFSYWMAAPLWLAEPSYLVFTFCWLLVGFIPLTLFGLSRLD